MFFAMAVRAKHLTLLDLLDDPGFGTTVSDHRGNVSLLAYAFWMVEVQTGHVVFWASATRETGFVSRPPRPKVPHVRLLTGFVAAGVALVVSPRIGPHTGFAPRLPALLPLLPEGFNRLDLAAL
jgi:hypothetical protein